MLISEDERQEIRQLALNWLRRLGTVKKDCILRKDIPWRPHLYCPDSQLAAHLLLYPGIDQRYLDAFKKSKQKMKDLKITIIGPVQFIQTPGVLEAGNEVDAGYVVLEDRDGRIKAGEFRDTLTLIHQMTLRLGRETYCKLASLALSRAQAAKGQQKGRRLESLIAFLLSQIPGFQVVSTNYNTATEEIDIVVRNRRVGGIFSAYSEPWILVECKNQKKRSSKDDYVSFATKIRNRRQAAAIGLFVSINGYTQDFRLESLRDSRERFVIAKLDSDDINKLVELSGEAAALYIERQIEEATLE